MRKQNLLIVSEEKVRLCIVERVCKKKKAKKAKQYTLRYIMQMGEACYLQGLLAEKRALLGE